MHPGLEPIAAAATACVIDAARIDGLPTLLADLGAEAVSLYSGPTAAELSDVAPYLVPCESGSDLANWFFGTAWGQSAGIVLQSEADLPALRSHLRHFLMVLDEVGTALYFRFYDPRVLRVFLPTCDPEQLSSLFGPISAFVVEAEEPTHALRFTLTDGALLTEPIELTQPPAGPKPVIEWKGRTP